MNAPDAATVLMARTGPAIPAAEPGPTPGADNYEIGRVIATGGMGSILEAEDGKLKRTVAVKMMRLEAQGDAAMRQRFVREAEVLAMLAHPNIVPVHDIVWEAGEPIFYTMKLVNGRTLQSILDDLRRERAEILRDFSLERLLLIFRKVCDAMAFAHSKGVLHRDLKPENIMVGEFGEVMVMDWGLAKLLGGHDAPGEPAASLASVVSGQSSVVNRQSEFSGTLAGSVMGTPQYMSPEQARGLVDELDERSDIYSLGGILCAILTLRPPVEGATMQEVLEKVSAGQITDPTTSRTSSRRDKSGKQGEVLEANQIKPLPHLAGRGVPAALSAVAMQALQLDKVRRYPDVTALIADIEAYQGGFATKAQQASPGRLLWLLVARHKAVSSTVAASILLIAMLAGGFVMNLQAKERRALAGEASAKAAEAVAVKKGEEARQALAKSEISLADAALRNGNGAAMRAALDAVPKDLRDSTWSYLLGESDTSIARIDAGGGEITDLAANPRAPGVFALADQSGKVTVMNVRTGARLLEFGPAFPEVCPPLRLAFSADGGRIAIGQDGAGGIVIHAARDGQQLGGWESPPTGRLEFSPDGKSLLQMQAGEKGLTIWDTETGQSRWDYRDEAHSFGTFTPDGLNVLTHGIRDHVVLRDSTDGAPARAVWQSRVKQFAIHPDGATAVMTILPDGATLANAVVSVNLRDGSQRFSLRPLRHEVQRLSFTPDGRRFITAEALPGGRQSLQVWNADTGERSQQLLGGSGPIHDLVTHPLSGELLVAGRETRAWSLLGPPEKWIWTGRDARAVFWGADDVLFTSIPHSHNALVSLKTDPHTVLWKPADYNFRGASISADGRFAAIGNPATAWILLLRRQAGPEIEEVGSFRARSPLSKLRLSPDGGQLAAIRMGTREVELVDAATGARPVKLERNDFREFHDLGWVDAKRLAGVVTSNAARGEPGSEERVVLWDTESGEIVGNTISRAAIDVLVVEPGGKRFAEAGQGTRVRIRDAVTLAVQQEFRAQNGPITALAWHPAKPILATAAETRIIRLWNLETGKMATEIRCPQGTPTTLGFSPSGRLLTASSSDASSRVWEIE